METLKIVLTVIQMIGSVFLIGVVLLQPSKKAGLSGSIAGAGDTFLSKNKSRSWDKRMERLTVIVGIVFVVITLAINFVI